MPNSKDADGAGAAGTDKPQPQYPVTSDRPGVELINPVGRARVTAALFAAAIVLASAMAAYVATTLADAKTNQHVDEVLAELDRRTAERRKNEGTTVSVLEQNRRTICELLVVADHTPKIVRLIDAYKCGTAKDPIVPPGWRPPPGWPPLPGSAPLVHPSTGTPPGR